MKKFYLFKYNRTLAVYPFFLIFMLSCQDKLDIPLPAKINKIASPSIKSAIDRPTLAEVSQEIFSLLEKQEQINVDANPHIKHYLEQIETVIDIEQFTPPRQYGGYTGREYFKAYTNYLLIPTMTEFINALIRVKDDKNIAAKSAGILAGLLAFSGKKRNDIAKRTFTKSFEKFGTPIADGSLLAEPIKHNSFTAWNKKIRQDLTEFFLNDEELHEAIIESKSIQPNDIKRKKYVKLGYEIALEGNISNLKITMVGEPKELSTTMEIELNLNRQDKIAKAFLDEKAAKIYIHHHTKHSKDSVWISEEIINAAKHFAKIINLTDRASFKNELGQLFRFINISSTFARGQAAISEWIIKSLSRSYGLDLQFSPAWTTPLNPSPDQHALSILNFAEYIKAFEENLSLIPLP